MRWPRRRRWAIRVVTPFGPDVVGVPLPYRYASERRATDAARRLSSSRFGEPTYEPIKVD